MKPEKNLSLKPRRRVASLVRQHIIRHRVTDAEGKELGETDGASKSTALRKLYLLARRPLTLAQAEEMVRGRLVKFERVA
jgi:hypothetical protein